MTHPILIELGRVVGPVEPVWTFGANTCHAALWLRDDLLRHLDLARCELGFRHIRCHGFLNQDVVSVNADGTFDFSRLHLALDRLLSVGLRPFVELSTMPECLSGGSKCITAYRFMCCPPKEWNRWSDLITALVDGLLKRYGANELREWHFEVWNEPDIEFWAGTQAEYFKMYDLAARAIKSADPTLRIGGPATSKTAWIREFCRHVTRPSANYGLSVPRCDFVSTHAYPSDIAFVDNDRGDVKLMNSNIMRQLFSEARQAVDETLGRATPLLCGEWNSSAGPLASNHDDVNNAAFIAKTMVELMPICQGSLYWNLSDIYEECHFHYEPFHGGYGLITVNDLPKASFHAFRLLREHRGERLEASLLNAPPGMGCLASRDERDVRILLYYYREPDVQNAEPVAIRIQGVAGAGSIARIEEVAPHAGSAYETWRDLGSPTYATRRMLEDLEAAARPRIHRVAIDEPINLSPGTIAQVALPRTGAS